MEVNSKSGRASRPMSGDDIADLCGEFASCDLDGDGLIGFSEFERVLQGVGSRLTDVQRRAEFLRIDTDENGRIDLTEFKRWYQGC
jgi:Ca2+-binding EF-hand superfamily protein